MALLLVCRCFWRDLILSFTPRSLLSLPTSRRGADKVQQRKKMASPSVKYRMIALDLDGTLLNSKHEVTDEMAAYLRELHDKGIIVAIATGRYVLS